MNTILDVKDLWIWMNRKGERIPAVRGLWFSVSRGGCTGVIGESGCGKSLTCQALTGLLEPRRWTVRADILLDKKPLPVTEDRAMEAFRGRQIGWISQDPFGAFDQRMTVGAHFCEGIFFWEREKKRERLREAAFRLEKMKIRDPEGVLASYPFQLSGGMLQRTMTALAVSRHPKLLVADEPTTALDADTQTELLELLRELRREEQIALLLVSHDLEVISRMADRILVMYAGQAVEYGTAKEVLEHPLHPYTIGLLQSRPSFSKERIVCMQGYPPGLREIPKEDCAFRPRCPRAQKQAGCETSGPQELKEVKTGHFVRCGCVEGADGSFTGSRACE